jgi:hypothetical protein
MVGGRGQERGQEDSRAGAQGRGERPTRSEHPPGSNRAVAVPRPPQQSGARADTSTWLHILIRSSRRLCASARACRPRPPAPPDASENRHRPRRGGGSSRGMVGGRGQERGQEDSRAGAQGRGERPTRSEHPPGSNRAVAVSANTASPSRQGHAPTLRSGYTSSSVPLGASAPPRELAVPALRPHPMHRKTGIVLAAEAGARGGWWARAGTGPGGFSRRGAGTRRKANAERTPAGIEPRRRGTAPPQQSGARTDHSALLHTLFMFLSAPQRELAGRALRPPPGASENRHRPGRGGGRTRGTHNWVIA